MHEYYFKIKKGDLEFEFSTTDKFTFEEKLSDWINGIVHGAYIEPPHQPPAQTQEQQHDNAQEPVVEAVNCGKFIGVNSVLFFKGVDGILQRSYLRAV